MVRDLPLESYFELTVFQVRQGHQNGFNNGMIVVETRASFFKLMSI